MWPTFRRQLLVQQIELQFHRDHRRQTMCFVAPENALQHLTRVGLEQAALGVFHLQQALRHRTIRPGNRSQSARHRPTDAVFVADVIAQSGFFDCVAGDVGGNQRHRQTDAVGIDLFQRVARNALAAQQAVHVGQDQIDHLR